MTASARRWNAGGWRGGLFKISPAALHLAKLSKSARKGGRSSEIRQIDGIATEALALQRPYAVYALKVVAHSPRQDEGPPLERDFHSDVSRQSNRDNRP